MERTKYSRLGYAYCHGTLVSPNLLETLDTEPTTVEQISYRRLNGRVFVSCDILNPNYELEIPSSDIWLNAYIWDYHNNQLTEDLPF